MPDLKRCPFCGGKGQLVLRSAPCVRWAVECGNRRCRGPEFKRRGAAINAWNRCAYPSKPVTTRIHFDGIAIRAEPGCTIDLGGNGFPARIHATIGSPTKAERFVLVSIGRVDRFLAVYEPDSGDHWAIENAEMEGMETDGDDMHITISGKRAVAQ